MKSIKRAAIGGIVLFALLNLAACGEGNGPPGSYSGGRSTTGGTGGGVFGGGSGTATFGYPTGPDSNEGGVGNGSIATATSHTIDTTAVNTIWPQGDQDYYAVSLLAGTEYEFSASDICATCDVYIFVFSPGGAQIASNDDYIGLDSSVRYTPSVSGTHYVMVRSFYSTFGVAQYTLGVRTFVDSDGDSYSNYHDCNDANDTIFPAAAEIAGDGIDQNCSSVDRLLSTTADSAEADNTSATARPMTALAGYYREIEFRDEAYMDNARTLHDASDEDWLSITVAARSRVNMRTLQSTGLVSVQYFDSDATTPVGSTITNNTTGSRTYYVRYSGSDASGAWIVQAYEEIGQDLDGDTYYTQDTSSNRDCDDTNAAINSGASETIGDNIDSDCDGSDS